MADPAGRRRRLLGHLQQHEAQRDPGLELLPERFRIIRELGRGGMGAVVLAHDTQLGRQVAVKVLLAQTAATLHERQRFETEGRALASLRHPNIVPVHELLRDQGALFLVMDAIEGESLAERISGDELEPREAARIALAVAEALGCAHEHGVLHRDVKPANVLLDSDGGVFLVDFGLAKQIDSTTLLTRTGQLIGTPAYLSPEQVQDARAVDARSDVYSLGACLFHMLTGEGVFPAQSISELIAQILTKPAPDPRGLAPQVPHDLAAICSRCLRKDAADRYGSAQALADDLRAFLAGEPTLDAQLRRRSRRVLGVSGVVVALLGVSLAAILANRTPDTPVGVEPESPVDESADPAVAVTDDADARRPSRQVLAHQSVSAVAFVAGRSDLIVSSADAGVRMWALGEDAHQRWEWKSSGVTWLAASPDGSVIACGRGAAVTLLRGADGQVLGGFELEAPSVVGLWLDDGRELLLGCEPPLGLQRMRTSDWTRLPTRRLDYAIHCLGFDPRTATIGWGGGSQDPLFNRLDFSRGSLHPKVEPVADWEPAAKPTYITPSRTPGEWVLAQRDGTLFILRPGQPRTSGRAIVAPPESHGDEYRILPPRAHMNGVTGLAFLDNGMLVSSSGHIRKGDLRVWDLNQPQPLVGLALRNHTIRALQVSADGRWVAIGTLRRGVVVYSAERIVDMAKRNGTLLGE